MIGPLYRVTDAGRKAWESKDPAVPSDYRFILWMIDFHGNEHLENLARQFPEQLLSDCLQELEELRLIAPVTVAHAGGAEKGAPVFSVGADELVTARHSLAQHGAYVAADRLKARPSVKPPSETVILIVEDDPDQLALADLRVSMAGYGVRVADSQAALLRSLAKEGTPDLVLLDVMLPDGDGFDILSKLRRLPSYSSLAIVMLTAKKDAADVAKGLSLGADGYIMKPYSKNILANVVGRILQHPAGGA
jgi:CheY-like chemotaxis protein